MPDLMQPPTIIVLSGNDASLIDCLSALRRIAPERTVIVVDDGIKDWKHVLAELGRTPFPKLKAYPCIRAVHGVKPFDYHENVAIGISAAGNSNVVVINGDALHVVDWIGVSYGGSMNGEGWVKSLASRCPRPSGSRVHFSAVRD